jgi:hypothetical protein
MKQSSTKFVSHEQVVAGVTFRAMVETARVVLHMENSSGHQSSVDLIGEAFALPYLCYSDAGWRRRGGLSGPPGRAVCHDSPREPRMFLGQFHDDVRLLAHEFGLHRQDLLGHQVAFENSIAGLALRQIMLHEPVRAALFRAIDAALDNWAEQAVSEAHARPLRMAL